MELSVYEYAAKARVSPTIIYRRIKRGRIIPKKVDGVYVIDDQRFPVNRQRERRGRPSVAEKQGRPSLVDIIKQRRQMLAGKK